MNAQLLSALVKKLLVPICIGAWAGAIALAPTLSFKLALLAPLLVIPLLWWSLLKPRFWLMLFFTMAILLPPLPVTISGSNPHPALLCVAIGLFIGILRFRRWRYLHASLTAGFGVFTAALLLSLVFAAFYSGLGVASSSFIRVLLFAIGPYVFFYTLAETQRHGAPDALRSARLLFVTSIAAALFACCDFYFQFPAPAGYSPQFLWLAEGVFRRAQGLFYDASTLGNYCVFFLVMIAAALFRPRAERPYPTVLLLSGGAILSTALIFSYSRASLLGLFISCCALAYMHAAQFRRGMFTIALGAVVSAIAAYLLFPKFAESYWLRLAASVQYLWSSPEGVLSGRVANWKALVEFAAREPWNAIFGIGYKSLPYSDYIGSATIGDNTYLTLLIETGVVGLSSFCFLNIEILRKGLKAARSAQPRARFFGTWIFCFWIGELVQMLSGDLITYWRVLPICFWTLAIAINESRTKTLRFETR